MIDKSVIALLDRSSRAESLVSPYLRRPLRSLDEVLAERRAVEDAMERRRRSQAAAEAVFESVERKRAVG